jgi:hypothetical protein
MILAKSDFLLTCPLGLAENFREMYPLTITRLPFWIPNLDTKMAWHGKDDGDPFHVWLRDRLAQTDQSNRLSQ